MSDVYERDYADVYRWIGYSAGGGVLQFTQTNSLESYINYWMQSKEVRDFG